MVHDLIDRHRSFVFSTQRKGREPFYSNFEALDNGNYRVRGVEYNVEELKEKFDKTIDNHAKQFTSGEMSFDVSESAVQDDTPRGKDTAESKQVDEKKKDANEAFAPILSGELPDGSPERIKAFQDLPVGNYRLFGKSFVRGTNYFLVQGVNDKEYSASEVEQLFRKGIPEQDAEGIIRKTPPMSNEQSEESDYQRRKRIAAEVKEEMKKQAAREGAQFLITKDLVGSGASGLHAVTNGSDNTLSPIPENANQNEDTVDKTGTNLKKFGHRVFWDKNLPFRIVKGYTVGQMIEYCQDMINKLKEKGKENTREYADLKKEVDILKNIPKKDVDIYDNYVKGYWSEDDRITFAEYQKRMTEKSWQSKEDEYLFRFGNILNADNAKLLFRKEGYDPHNEDSVKKFHPEAGKLIRNLFARLLKERKGKGNGIVVFTGGGNGSGKSTAMQSETVKNADFVFDSTMVNKDAARESIQQVLDNGQTPLLLFVYRNPADAWHNGVNERNKSEDGHIVPKSTFANTHSKSKQNFSDLVREFGDKVKYIIYDNSNGGKKITLDELEAKPKYTKEQIQEAINAGTYDGSREILEGFGNENSAGISESGSNEYPQENKRGRTEVLGTDTKRSGTAGQLSGTEQPVNTTPEAAKSKIEDFGEKIEGARKDLADGDGVRYSVVTPEENSEIIKNQTVGTKVWLRAPNGSHTNLTEKQWSDVRTPNFRNYFGDWEIASLYNNAAKRWNNPEYKFTYNFIPSEKLKYRLEELLGHEISSLQITGDTVQHIKDGHSSGETERGQHDIDVYDIACIPYLLNNFDSAELYPLHDDKQGHHAIEVKKRINGISVIGTIEKGNAGVHVVTAWKMIKSSDAPMNYAPGPNALSDSDIQNIQRDLQKIKDGIEKSSKIVDENGEPLVVYHGTDEKFSIFDMDKGRANKELVNRETKLHGEINANQRNKLVSNAAMNKSKHNGFTYEEHFHAIANIDRLFENGSLVDDRPDNSGDRNVISIKRFVAPVLVNGTYAEAYITVKETVGNKIYSLELDELKKPSDLTGGTLNERYHIPEGYNKLLQKIEKANKLVNKTGSGVKFTRWNWMKLKHHPVSKVAHSKSDTTYWMAIINYSRKSKKQINS